MDLGNRKKLPAKKSLGLDVLTEDFKFEEEWNNRELTGEVADPLDAQSKKL